MPRPAPTLALVACLAAALLPGPAAAASLEGADFPGRVQERGARLELHRLALFRWRWLVRVYVAGLYLGDGARAQAVLDDVPKRLEIHYLVAFDADDFRRSTTEGIRRNTDAATFARLAPAIDAMNALYRAVEPGDRYAVTYVPGSGTSLRLDGELLGSVPGADFARAYFAIWLGDAPFDEGLRRDLLGPS